MRHYTTYASGDRLITELLEDPAYEVRADGTVLRKGKVTGLALTLKRGKHYRHMKYRGVNLLVHRIVYAKYVGSLNPRRVVNHIDGDSLNNQASNLELVTQSENMTHAHS